jgi:CelD/BcsL family acetyltransferase involved in cellulose biosynthesis
MLRQLYELKAESGCAKQENLFRDESRREFLITAAQSAAPPAELFRLVRGEEWIAALLTFRDGAVRRFYTTWFNPTWRKHSPGVALLYEATRLSLADGLECDYMTGEQPFKLRFATGANLLYRLAVSANQARTRTAVPAVA